MVNINNVFPTKYLAVEDLNGGERTMTINRYDMETFDDGDTKLILYFNEIQKGLTVNKTNAKTLSGMYGPETDDWIGKRLILFSIWTEYQGKPTQGIRVRPPQQFASGQPMQSHQAPLDPAPAGAREFAPLDESAGI